MSVGVGAGVEARECGDGSRVGMVVGGERSDCEAGGERDVVGGEGAGERGGGLIARRAGIARRLERLERVGEGL